MKMEKELNLVELLKDAPKGIKLYSPICGECFFKKVEDYGVFPIRVTLSDDRCLSFTKKGRSFSEGQGECLLFPAENNRDWSTFKKEPSFKVGDYVKEKEGNNVFRIKTYADVSHYYVTLATVRADNPIERMISVDCLLSKFEKVNKFDPQWLKPFDRVLVRNNRSGGSNIWSASFFSHITEETGSYLVVDRCRYGYCIPFNEETKSLVGTNDEEPEFYKI